jgi:putative hydrolase of the HAD superfamily
MIKYEFLFFDLDNTLWDFTVNAREALKQTLENMDLIARVPSFEEYFQRYEQINDSLWSDYRAKKVTKQALIVERFSRSLEAFHIHDQDWEGINHHYLDCMALQTQLFPGTLETLGYLKAKGYQMHIITNGFKEVQNNKLINSGLSEFFGRVFISEEIQTTKPHRQIFEHALKSSNARKKKSIMIGDSWEIDIVGAQGFGMDQIMFLNNGRNPVPESIKSNFLADNSTYLELKGQQKTFFVNEITGLKNLL